MLAAVRRRLFLLRPGDLSAAFSTVNATSAADPTVSYLISSCGLSPRAAASAARAVRLDSPGAAAQADAVLALLRGYDFSDADISSTVKKLPSLLAANPAKTLQPNLYFLASVGIEAPLLPRLVSLFPPILHRSVQDHLEPFFASLREVLGSDARVVAALRSQPFAIRFLPKASLFRIVPLFRDVHGLSADDVSKLVAIQPTVIALGPDRINGIMEAARKVGIKPGNPMFVHVFSVLCRMRASTLESKVALYQRLGFHKDDVSQIIRRFPMSIAVSEKKIAEVVGFLTHKAGLTLDDIIVYPNLLVRSLQTLSRRCAVLAVLRRSGKLQQQYRLPVLLACTRERFLDAYVRPHVEEVPDVLQAMNGEIPFQGFDCFDSLEKKPQLPRKKRMSP
ncbi:hypothetical protein EJB05_35517, partial [Eragrostis curvula]